MKARPDEPGRVVISSRGHDRGTWYCVTAIKENLIWCADGKNHPLEKPKKKNEKHLWALPLQIDLTQQGADGGKFGNSDLRKALSTCRKGYETQTGRQELPGGVEQKEDCALVQE